MSTLAKWQSFARSTGLKGWSRLKKNELVDFLMQNLWFGGGLDDPKMNKAARLRTRKYQKNPLDKKIPAIKVPILIPGKKICFPKSHSQSDQRKRNACCGLGGLVGKC